MTKTISAGLSPTIRIDSVGGDLSVVGWDGQDVLIKADDDEVRVEQNKDQVIISCDDDLSLRVPKGASLLIQSLSGDGAIRGLNGGIELKEVHGDLSMRDVNSVAIDTLHADFSLRGANGHLSIKSTHADVSIRDVQGNISLESVADDLVLRDVHGNVSANVGEDVVLYLNPKPENNYSITAGSDILLVLPPKADATLTMSGDEIEMEWPGIKSDDSTSRVVSLGNGSARIVLDAGGDIRVSNRADAGESADEFGNFAGINFDWSDFGRDLGDRISRRVQEATRRADEAVRRAERQAERHSRRWKGNVNVGRWNWDISPQGVPTPVPPAEPVSDEERMSILKMLQEKKITSEQAEQLLAALEGGK